MTLHNVIDTELNLREELNSLLEENIPWKQVKLFILGDRFVD